MHGLDLLNVEEVAAMLRVPTSWIYARTSGKGEQLPYLKIGRHLRFRRAEILEWVEGQSRNSQKLPVTN